MMKCLSIVALLSCCTTSGAFRLGLIRIPKDEDAELVFRSVGRENSGEFGSTQSNKKLQAVQAKELFHATFRELFHDFDMSLSLSMSMPYTADKPPTPAVPTPVIPDDDPLVAPPITEAPKEAPTTPDVPKTAPGGGSDNEEDTQAAATSDARSSSSSRAPQIAMISTLTVAAAAVIVAMVARKVYASRKAGAGGKSLSGESDQSTEPEQSHIVTTTV